jgi:hypothetical protein
MRLITDWFGTLRRTLGGRESDTQNESPTSPSDATERTATVRANAKRKEDSADPPEAIYPLW